MRRWVTMPGSSTAPSQAGAFAVAVREAERPDGRPERLRITPHEIVHEVGHGRTSRTERLRVRDLLGVRTRETVDRLDLMIVAAYISGALAFLYILGTVQPLMTPTTRLMAVYVTVAMASVAAIVGWRGQVKVLEFVGRDRRVIRFPLSPEDVACGGRPVRRRGA